MEPQIGEIERITKRELRETLQRGEEVIIVDARDSAVFDASDIMPKGAVRVAPGASNGEIARLPKDKTIVPV